MVSFSIFNFNKRGRNGKTRLCEELWEKSVCLTDKPKRLTYRDLRLATDDFNGQRTVGNGDFAVVFKGILKDNHKTRVAVKCFRDSYDELFMMEAKTTGSIHHFNVVKLIGYCVEKKKRFLVYECMINGSLDNWIFKQEKTLTWKTRKKIMLHIAKGLSYLHEDCRIKIIHADIKPSNILLDEEFNAKLGDFGLVELADKEESSTVVGSVRGTFGYMSPERFDERVITEKVDVYSFGIVMLEVMFQRRNIVPNLDGENHKVGSTLNEFVREKSEENRLWEAVEECCGEDEEMRMNIEEVEKMMKLAVWCLESDPAARPSMSRVVYVLEGAMPLKSDADSSSRNT